MSAKVSTTIATRDSLKAWLAADGSAPACVGQYRPHVLCVL